MDEVDVLRRNVEQFKFGKGDEPVAVAEWGAELDGEIKETDEAIAKLTDAINEVRSNHSTRDREKQQELKQKEREEQLQFEKRQFELKLEYEHKLEETFWNKFEAEIDKSDLAPTSVNNCRGSRVAGRKSRVAGRKSRVAGKKSRVNFNYLIIIFNRNKSSKKASGADCVYC